MLERKDEEVPEGGRGREEEGGRKREGGRGGAAAPSGSFKHCAKLHNFLSSR